MFGLTCSPLAGLRRRSTERSALLFVLMVWLYPLTGLAGVDHLLRMCEAGDLPAIKNYHHAHTRDGMERVLALNPGLKAFGRINEYSWPVNCMMVAAAKGHHALVVYLKTQGVSTDAANLLNITPLHMAANTGQADVISELLDFGVNINTRSISGRTALMQALIQGHMPAAERILGHRGVDIFIRENGGRTALHIAAEQGMSELVVQLLALGAHVNIGDIRRQTPLHMAAMHGKKTCVEKLLESGANIDARDKDGLTPLIWASSMGHREVVELLINNNANVTLESSGFGSALKLASMNGHKDVITVLGSHYRASPLPKFGDALHQAAKNGHLMTVVELLDQGADVNAFNREGFQPLHLAAENGHLDVVVTLVERGGEIDGGKETSPLMLAVSMGHVPIVQYLLDNRARPEPGDKTSESDNPLKMAITTQYPREDANQPGVAAQLVEALVKKGAWVNHVGKDGHSPLTLAAQIGRSDLVKILLEHGADPTLKANPAEGGSRLTPLQYAALLGNSNTAGVLLENQKYLGTSPRGLEDLITYFGAWTIKNSYSLQPGIWCCREPSGGGTKISTTDDYDGETITTRMSHSSSIPMLPLINVSTPETTTRKHSAQF